MTSFDAVIVGAGIAGLCCAIRLAKSGWRCAVIDKRDKDELGSGYGIQLSAGAIACLETLEVADELQNNSVRAQRIDIFSHHQAKLASIDLRSLQPYWLTSRHRLIDSLQRKAADLQNISWFYQNEIEACHDKESFYQIKLRQGQPLTAKLVIDASGHNQPLFPTIYQRQRLKNDYVAIRKNFHSPHSITQDNNSISLWLAPNTHMVCYPLDYAGNYNLVLVCKNKWRTDKSVCVGDITDYACSNFHNKFAKNLIIERLSASRTLRSWQLYDSCSAVPAMRYGRIALIGDSVQPVLPFLSQGARLAIGDALSLAEALKGGDVRTALADYQAERSPIRLRASRAARLQGFINHQDFILARMRNYCMRFLPSLILARYRRLLRLV